VTLRSEYSTSQPFYISINKISLQSTRQIRQKHNHLSIPLVSPPHPLPNPNPNPKTHIFLLTACVRPRPPAPTKPCLCICHVIRTHVTLRTYIPYSTYIHTYYLTYISRIYKCSFPLPFQPQYSTLSLAVSYTKNSQGNIGTVRYRLLS
jgi:hypothetical protein